MILSEYFFFEYAYLLVRCTYCWVSRAFLNIHISEYFSPVFPFQCRIDFLVVSFVVLEEIGWKNYFISWLIENEIKQKWQMQLHFVGARDGWIVMDIENYLFWLIVLLLLLIVTRWRMNDGYQVELLNC